VNCLHETMAWLRAEIEKRIAAHNTIAELCGEQPLPLIAGNGSSSEPIAEPKPAAKHAEPLKSSPGVEKRKSKYFEPLIKALRGGGKTNSELERILGKVQACFLGVLVNNPATFKKVGSGRGSTWELVEASK